MGLRKRRRVSWGQRGLPSAAKRIEPVDLLVGRRMRAYRQNLGMSQSALGEKVGVTFQQIQKYENGLNRIGSSRLKKVATVLGVGIAALFEDESGADQTADPALTAILRQPYAARLLMAFRAITNARQRLALVKLAESFGERSK